MTRRFRPEIQLLRALAVAAVVVYHLNPDWLPGGFVGVDVFFVISGYLITAHLLREIEVRGRLPLLEFWTNRARRILPAATVAILATALAAPVFLPATRWTDTALQGIASAFYVQNLVLAGDSVDYLQHDAADSPFQHFWSLSVEEQFYVFWPLLALLAFLIARPRTGAADGRSRGASGRWARVAGRRGVGRARLAPRGRRSAAGRGAPTAPPVDPRRFRLVALAVFGVAVLTSLTVSVVQVQAGDPAAYFLTHTRVWELGIGGLLACVLGDPQRFPRLRRGLALAGLSAILASAVLYTGATPFPGLAALLPTLGCAAVIVAGRTSGPGSLTRLVDSAPVQSLGAWSYSLYLWHFPLIVFYVARAGEHPGILEGIGLAAIALTLAIASYRLVEEPVRRSWTLQRHHWLTAEAAVAAMALAAVVAVVPQAVLTVQSREDSGGVDALVSELPETAGAGSLRGEDYAEYAEGFAGIIAPTPVDAGDDKPEFPECADVPSGVTATSTAECVIANPQGERSLVVVGDSHAAQWTPAIRDLVAGTEWKVTVFLHDSCPFNAEPRSYETSGELECTTPNATTLQRILDMEPDKVFTTNYASTDMAPGSTEEFPGTRGYVDVWSPLAEAGIEVLVLEDTPIPTEEEPRPDCIAAHPEGTAECGFPREESREGEELNGAMRAAAAQVPGVRLVNLTDRFCTADFCPALVGSVLVYRDANHITTVYGRTVARDLDERLLRLG